MGEAASGELHHGVRAMSRRALTEIDSVFESLAADAADRMCDEILRGRRIACYGVGREGLMMKALCMRLMHLGLDAHVVGDMTTPRLGNGDLLVASAGPGSFSTVLALLGVARAAGARTMVVTAQPGGSAPSMADVVIELPAQTMATDRGGSASLLPMGSLYEAAQLILFDLISILLRAKTGQSSDEMRARHTNLE
jgi:6-phospho-3-hexuloisomerase